MPSVLIVDDDDQVRTVLRKALAGMGYDALESADGQDAVRRCREHCPDVLVVDLIMPGKEGLETIQEIRQFRPDAKIVAISGGGMANPATYLHVAERLGADRILSKPFDPSELLEVLEDLLKTAPAAASPASP